MAAARAAATARAAAARLAGAEMARVAVEMAKAEVTAEVSAARVVRIAKAAGEGAAETMRPSAATVVAVGTNSQWR